MEFKCDYEVFHPLGGASYVFEKDLIKYIVGNLHKKKIIISVGAQPNSSPHFGTLCVFTLAFSLAKKIKNYDDSIDVSVLFEVVDTAPGKTIVINGISYQQDLKNTIIMDDAMQDFEKVLNFLSKRNNIKYKIRKQSEFNDQKEIKYIVDSIVKKKDILAKLLDPKKERLRIRSSCPKCGLVDKEGVNTKIIGTKIISICPEHGEYIVDYLSESKCLEYNTPLRNLVRGIMYGTINSSDEYDYEIMRVTGGDYAGFYQEELLYKTSAIVGFDCSKLPMILYSPQILDWSGAKLSKSLYVKQGAYQDLPKYIINYHELDKEFGDKGLEIINDEIDSWLDEPYRLFRNYTVYYFMKIFNERLGEKND